MKYWQKLKDPRWQRKRLEVLERDEFKCVVCEDDMNTLHVHHRRYCKDPWDSPLEDLETLCERCHENVELAKREVLPLFESADAMITLLHVLIKHKENANGRNLAYHIDDAMGEEAQLLSWASQSPEDQLATAYILALPREYFT